jgi:hypothetical protein
MVVKYGKTYTTHHVATICNITFEHTITGTNREDWEEMRLRTKVNNANAGR